MRKIIAWLFLMILFATTFLGKASVRSASAAMHVEEFSPTSLPPIDWNHYHNYSEVVTILLALNETYPNVVDVFSIGKSIRGLDIYCLRLTNKSNSTPKPEVFFVGYHHAREPITYELALYFAVYAATNFGSNATVTNLLNRSEIYIVVALNVDGFDLFAHNDWQRKNARPSDEDGDGRFDEDPPEDENGDGFIEQLIDYTNPYNPQFIRWEGQDNDGDGQYGEDWIGGVDLNRNYNYSWSGGSPNPRSEIYRGTAPFSEPETQAIRDLVRKHHFTYAISFHSGAELILYPWGYTYANAPDEAKFIEATRDMSELTGGTTYEQSSDLYISYGLWDDWLYGVAGVYAFTCEIFSNDTYPGVSVPGPYPNTYWEGGLKYWFNPFPYNIPASINRWLPVFFYITNRTINEATPYHDVGISMGELEKTVVGEGYSVKINVSVKNKGFFAETFNVAVYANSAIIHTQTVNLNAGESTKITISWNTAGFPKAQYTIRAYATPVSGEIRTFDNTYTVGSITVSIIGDVDGDFDVDIFDLVKITSCYGKKRGDPAYNPNSDINGDGIVTIFDVVLCTSHYGQKYP
jgi:hypothetical protein